LSLGAEERPAVVALVIDTSGSLTGADLLRARELATGVLAALPAGSEAAVFSFDDRSRLVQDRTADADAVRTAVEALHTQGSYTALYDALYDASRYLRDAPGARHAILLVTDGKDERSALNLEDGLALAQQTHVPVFCVGLGRVEERVLRRVAKLTGGEYYPGFAAEASTIAARVLEIPTVPETPPTTVPSPSPAAPTPVAPLPPPQAERSLAPLFWAGAGLLLLVLSGILARQAAVRSRAGTATARGGPSLLDTRHAAAPADDEPKTVLARMDLKNERVAKTVLLRERPMLVVTKGARLGHRYSLSSASALSVGRARANDVVLDDEAVSGQHCRIRPEGDKWVVLDLGSTNGTRVNDRLVASHTLAEGDVIRIGATSLEFRVDRD
jgi:hypothetical protein